MDNWPAYGMLHYKENDTLNELYLKMKSKGLDMSWYEKCAHRVGLAIPLDDDICSAGSIYMFKKDGSLWSIDTDGKAYKQVREATNKIVELKYNCAHCHDEWATYKSVTDIHKFK